MIELKNVKKIYHSKKAQDTTALNNLNMTIGNSGMVFIVGTSGSGKSTLLNVLGGLDGISGGEILVNGENISKFSNEEYDSFRNTYIGFVFQDFNVLEQYNVYENIELALKLQNKKVSREYIDELLEKLGIKNLGNRKINELSGGQKQRVAIARALIKNPRIILADEPTGNLDKESSEQIFRLLKEISKKHLVIIVSHDISAAISYADRIIKIEDGKVISDTKEEVQTKIKPIILKKSKLPFSYALKMAITSFKTKPFKLFMTILLTTISLIFMGFTVNCAMFDKGMFITSTMKDNNRFTYEFYNSKFGSQGEVNPLELTDKNFKEIKNITKTIPNVAYNLYDNGNNLLFEFGENNVDLAYYRRGFFEFNYIEVKDDRLLSDLIGRKPEKPNELVIHKYLADYIMKFGVMDITNTLYFPTSYNDLVYSKREIKLGENKVIITGIIDDDNRMFSKEKERKVFSNKELDNYYSYNYGVNSHVIYVKGFVDNVILRSDKSSALNNATIRGNIKQRTKNIMSLNEQVNVITNSGIIQVDYLNKNETIISLDTLKMIDDSFESEYNMFLSINSLENSNESLTRFLSLYMREKQDKINLSLDVSFVDENSSYYDVKLKVVGITLGDNNYISYDYIKEYNPILKKSYYVKIYDDNIANLKRIFKTIPYGYSNRLDKTPGIYYNYNLENNEDISNVIGIYTGLAKYILVISLIFVLFTFLLFSNFISVSISYCKKEIGILRALGARNKDIIKIFGYESIIISIISWILSISGWYLICWYLNNSLYGDKYYILKGIVTHPLVPIIMFSYTIFIAIFITCVSISRITKIKPIDAILNK